MAMTVEDCALALDVLAGHDPLDPRQHPGTDPAGSYAHALPGDPDDLTVGVVMEGFGIDDGVDGTVRNALAEFETAGATVEELSIPWHTHALDIWIAVTTEEGVSIARDERVGHYLQGHYDTHFLKNYARARRGAGEKFPPTVKLKTLVGEYMMDRYHGYYHAKAQNLRRRLTAAYDDALESVDVLAMPTVPVTAYERESDLTRKELLRRAQGKAKRGKNTTAFNMTGHPAISVPCGNADELPVGLMFAAPHQADETLLSAADAFERSVEWRSVTP
jgi:amidase